MTKEEFAIKWFDRKIETTPKPNYIASVFWPVAAQRAIDYEDMIQTEINKRLNKIAEYCDCVCWHETYCKCKDCNR